MLDRSEKLRVALVMLAVAVAGALQLLSSAEPSPNVECTLQAEADQIPLRLGKVTAPIRSMVIRGHLDRATGRLTDFDGQAAFEVDGAMRRARVGGSLSVDSAGIVEGLVLTVEDAAFDETGLRVNTLNAEGMLDYDRTRAFIFTHPTFKMSHPVRYRCSTSLASGAAIRGAREG